jgi:hypothetical protein
MKRVWQFAFLVVLVGCPTARNLPPEPAPEEPKPQGPACGKVFKDAKIHSGSGCCVGPSARVLKSDDITAGCGVAPDAYLGQTRDGAACRFQFKAAGAEIKDSAVMVSHPVIPTGTPAPTGPDPLLPWSWKKVPLRDAAGFQAIPSHEGKPPENQTILWAGRGRRIVGLHVAKSVCTEAQAFALLQKAIDAAE